MKAINTCFLLPLLFSASAMAIPVKPPATLADATQYLHAQVPGQLISIGNPYLFYSPTDNLNETVVPISSSIESDFRVLADTSLVAANAVCDLTKEWHLGVNDKIFCIAK